MRLLPVLPVVAVLAALALTGCDDTSSVSSGTVGDPATPSSSPADAPSPTAVTPTAPSPSVVTPSPPSTTAPGPGPGATAPGTVLSYGDPAVVEVFAAGNPKAKVEYTVTGVEMSDSGTTALGPVARISIDVRAIDDLTDVLALALVDWDGIDEFGNSTVFGFEDDCDDKLPVRKPGETGTMCVAVSLTGDGTQLSEVQFGSGIYREDPIIWRP